MSYTQRDVAVRAAHSRPEGYSTGAEGGLATGALENTDAHATGGIGFADTQAQFGQYRGDSMQKEQVRTFYDTLNAMQGTGAAAGGIQRVAPITPEEIALMAEQKEVEKKKEWDAYWLDQCTPAQPWTMTAVAEVAPELMARRMDAIRSVSQYNLDVSILRHMGHGGDPRLAHLQYMIDQGEMDHMPTYVHMARHRFEAGPYSLFSHAGTSDRPKRGVFSYRTAPGVFLPNGQANRRTILRDTAARGERDTLYGPRRAAAAAAAVAAPVAAGVGTPS